MRAWNNHYSAMTDINLDLNKVLWEEERPATGTVIRIVAVNNGYTLHNDITTATEVFKNIWELSDRVRELLLLRVPHEEDFLPSHYGPETLEKLGLTTEGKPF